MNKSGHCYYPNEEHEMDKPSGCCCYWDEERGIESLQICNDHYNQHILRYFPDSRMAEYLRNQGVEIVKQAVLVQPSLFAESL